MRLTLNSQLITRLPPQQLAESILAKETRMAEILGKIKCLLKASK